MKHDQVTKANFGDLVRLIDELADTMTSEFKASCALRFAIEELKKAGNQAAANKITRFMKCKSYSTMPADLKSIVRPKTKKKVAA